MLQGRPQQRIEATCRRGNKVRKLLLRGLMAAAMTCSSRFSYRLTSNPGPHPFAWMRAKVQAQTVLTI